MSTRPSKRPRAATNEAQSASTPAKPSLDTEHIVDLVNSFKATTTKSLLITAAQSHPAVAQLIQHESDRLVRLESQKVIDFDHFSKSAWKALNVTYDRMRDSDAFMMSGEASGSVEGYISRIADQCPPFASFRTKQNALETLRKIAKSICLSVGVIPREVRNGGTTTTLLVEAMKAIIAGLSVGEKEKLQPWAEDKLAELEDIGESVLIGMDSLVDSILCPHGKEDVQGDGSEGAI